MSKKFKVPVESTNEISGSRLVSTNSVGDEGGEITLNKSATNTTLNTGVTIDVWQNRVRIFETGGTNRGAYIDLTSATNSVGTNLLTGGGSGISNVVEDTTPQLGGDLDALGNAITNVESVGFDTTPATEPSTAGSLWWNQDFETLNLQLDSAVTLQVGQEHLIRVKNSSGSVAIPNFTFVMFAGATGDTVTVSPAVTDGTVDHQYMVGITTEEIPADGFGFVTQFGFVNNIDTSTYTLGQLLYPNPSVAGGFTTTQPPAPAFDLPVAAVTRVNASSGRVLVRINNGLKLKDLHDIQIDSPADNEVLAYNSANGTWINQTAAEANLVTLNGTETLSGKTLSMPVMVSPNEKWTVSATAATGTIQFDVSTQSVLYYTSNATANHTLNFRGNSFVSLNSLMAVGNSATIVWAVTNGATAYRPTVFQIDGTSVTPKWQGGAAPTAGNANSIDIYTFTIVKTSASPAYTVFASQTKFA